MRRVLCRRFLRPVSTDIDILPREPPLEEQEEQVIHDDAQAEELPGPDAAAVVALQPVNQRKVADATPVVAGGVEAVKLLLANGAADAVVDALRAHGDVGPRVHLFDLVVEFVGADLAGAHGGDGFARGGDDVVFFGLCEGGHVRGEDLGDAADLGAHDVEAARGRFDNDGAKGLCQGRVEVDVAAGHDVADVLVADGAEHLDAVLQHVGLDHLLQVNSLGARAGDDEAGVGVVLQDARDGGREEIGAFVVEEARYDDNGDDVVGAEEMRRWLGSEAFSLVG